MATNTNFGMTRDQIIAAALRKCSSSDSGDTIPPNEITDAAMQLNAIVKELMARVDGMWQRKEVTLFLDKSTNQYSLGTANATKSYVETDVKTAGVTSDVSIDVDSTTGMTVGDVVGIKLDDDTIHWTTILTIPDTDTIIVPTGLASAAAVDNPVYTFTTKADKPNRILTAYRRDTSSNDTPVKLVGRVDYSRLSLKTSTGITTEVHHDRQRDSGELYVWPTPDGSQDKLILIVAELITDMDTAASVPHFPPEWDNPLVWTLAFEMAPEYAVPLDELRMLKAVSKEKVTDLLDYDIGEGSVYMTVGNRR